MFIQGSCTSATIGQLSPLQHSTEPPAFRSPNRMAVLNSHSNIILELIFPLEPRNNIHTHATAFAGLIMDLLSVSPVVLGGRRTARYGLAHFCVRLIVGSSIGRQPRLRVEE
jgi:hypothetical protein